MWRWTLYNQVKLSFQRRSRSLSESPTQTIDSSPCCKTGPSSGPPKWKCLTPPLPPPLLWMLLNNRLPNVRRQSIRYLLHSLCHFRCTTARPEDIMLVVFWSFLCYVFVPLIHWRNSIKNSHLFMRWCSALAASQRDATFNTKTMPEPDACSLYLIPPQRWHHKEAARPACWLHEHASFQPWPYPHIGVGRGMGDLGPPWILKFSGKKVVFLVSSGKN